MDAAALTLPFLVGLILVALAFDFLNGMNDAANAIATIVSTRVLRPQLAVAWAAFFNFVAFLFFGLHVAETVGRGIVEADIVNEHVIFGALAGAIVWQIVTQRLGIPSSSSHALIGGLVGSALAAGALVHWNTVIDKVLIPMVVSPVAGFFLAFLLMLSFMWILRKKNPKRVTRNFRMLQPISAAALALGHGLQDAQKTMGVIFLALITTGHAQEGDRLPLWVVISAAAAISAGTYSGGWRIMRTMGRKIIDLDPARGFAAETVGASVLYTTAYVFEAPVSTTHIITSAIMGAGATRRLSAVRWGMARSILVAWVLTFPMAGLAAAACYGVAHFVLP